MSDLPDNWFRPARGDEDADAGGITSPTDGSDEPDEEVDPQTATSASESPSETTVDPETTGRLSLGDPDEEGPVVVVGRPGPRRRGGFDRSGIRWSWLLLAALICLVIGLVAGVLVRGHNSQDEPLARAGVTRVIADRWPDRPGVEPPVVSRADTRR